MAKLQPPRHASAPTDHSPTTSPTQLVRMEAAKNSNPQTSPSTSSRPSKKTSANASATKKNAIAFNANAPSPPGMHGFQAIPAFSGRHHNHTRLPVTFPVRELMVYP